MSAVQARHDTPPLSAVFQALADDRRRHMIARLAARPRTVSELADPLGLRLPAALKHLAVLEAGGIVRSAKAGRIRTYSIRPDALSDVARWVAQCRATLTEAFDRLDAAIAEFPDPEPEQDT
ncbi:ArsR/SmtB family transcription factor [Salipiger sp.]|uniref:ArsR/SmtB family transcription factor n=1 Tax=Salipiger sp. TaxID=2078585 RepID=UPI003A96FBE1